MAKSFVPRVMVVALVLAATSASALVTTGQDASPLSFVACNGRVGFRTSEAQQGITDLNGDGDKIDFVLQVVDLGTPGVTNVGIDASGALACSGDVFVFGVSEAAQGNADRNGDGDAFDQVLAAYDAGTATLTNVGLAVTSIAVSSSLVAFTVNETSQGALDRNGDSDVFDQVLAVLDPGTLAVTNVAREAGDAGNIKVNGTRVAFVCSEAAQGNTDMNGDGDPLDTDVLFWSGGTVVNPNRAVDPALGLALDSAIAAFVVIEAAHGNVTANGDPDAADKVVQAWCFGGAPCPTVGLINVGIDASGGIRLAGDLLAFRTREGSEPGGSLNPDGDKGDFVVQYYRFSTATVTSTGLAAKSSFQIVGSRIALGVPENKQGYADRNGDFDARDIVLAIYNTASSTATNTLQSLWAKTCKPEPRPGRPRGTCLATGTDAVIFPSGERSQGKTDLNGDGDIRDAVLHVWRLSSGMPPALNSNLAAEHKTVLVAGGTLGAFRVSERRQGPSGTDRNSDGDKFDNVLAAYDELAASFSNIARAADDFILIEGRNVVFRTNEAFQNSDLNSDGDLDDVVLEYQPFP